MPHIYTTLCVHILSGLPLYVANDCNSQVFCMPGCCMQIYQMRDSNHAEIRFKCYSISFSLSRSQEENY